MIQQLATETRAQTWVIISMLFFATVFLAVAIRVLTRKRGAYDAQARLPLDDGVVAGDGAGTRSYRGCPTEQGR